MPLTTSTTLDKPIYQPMRLDTICLTSLAHHKTPIHSKQNFYLVNGRFAGLPVRQVVLFSIDRFLLAAKFARRENLYLPHLINFGHEQQFFFSDKTRLKKILPLSKIERLDVLEDEITEIVKEYQSQYPTARCAFNAEIHLMLQHFHLLRNDPRSFFNDPKNLPMQYLTQQYPDVEWLITNLHSKKILTNLVLPSFPEVQDNAFCRMVHIVFTAKLLSRIFYYGTAQQRQYVKEQCAVGRIIFLMGEIIADYDKGSKMQQETKDPMWTLNSHHAERLSAFGETLKKTHKSLVKAAERHHLT